MSSRHQDEPILILGAGINGAAIARELALNGCSVLVVDPADIASGTTAYSSRLIHGGLRYLEHGEFRLVRESLAERARLLQLAPQFVRPLQLFIPVRTRLGGLGSSLARATLGISSTPATARGLWTVRTGLWLYDRYARDQSLGSHQVFRVGDQRTPPVSDERFTWLCSYWDAQMPFPERFVLALLKDAAVLARENGATFRVLNYYQAQLDGRQVHLHPLRAQSSHATETLTPSAIINATGAWVDHTLSQLGIEQDQLIAGTKGSHFFTWNDLLATQLGGRGIYVEAADGRPVFLLPLAGGTLVGTTDLPFEGDPAKATAEPAEIEYLLQAVNQVFPDLRLAVDDIAWHYCGVRPLPPVDARSTAAITRRHWLHQHEQATLPFYSVIGGKLTTCRSLAEETADTVLRRLLLRPRRTTKERPLPADNRLAWGLFELTPGEVRNVIHDEWVCCLEDLVERRLMLLYDRQFGKQHLERLAELLVEVKVLTHHERCSAVQNCAARLSQHFGCTLS